VLDSGVERPGVKRRRKIVIQRHAEALKFVIQAADDRKPGSRYMFKVIGAAQALDLRHDAGKFVLGFYGPADTVEFTIVFE
jgi:hypothetical protein